APSSGTMARANVRTEIWCRLPRRRSIRAGCLSVLRHWEHAPVRRQGPGSAPTSGAISNDAAKKKDRKRRRLVNVHAYEPGTWGPPEAGSWLTAPPLCSSAPLILPREPRWRRERETGWFQSDPLTRYLDRNEGTW